MADQQKRSDLIRLQIENLMKNAPQPYSKAEQDQIMKGRGKSGTPQQRQADIDAGRAAIEARNKEIRDLNSQVSSLNEQLGTAEGDERKAGREDIEGATKKRYDEESSTGYGRAATLGANALTLPGGFIAGRYSGKAVNALADISQTSKNKRLEGVAQDRLSGLTTRKGALAATERSGAMPSSNSVLRVGGRMLPHAIGGVAGVVKGGSMLANSAKGDDFYADTTNRAMGLGLIGSGVGLVQEGGRYAVNPTVAPDAKSIAIIESENLRRGKAAPTTGGLTPKQMLVAEAKAAGIKNVGKMNMGQLQSALSGVTKSLPKAGVLGPLAIPAAAGAFAFGMTPERAEASADGSEGGGSNTGEALTNAAGAAGATYGASRGLGALARYAPTAMKAAGGALGMMSPFAAADMTDVYAKPFVADEKEYQRRNSEVRSMPFLRHLTPGHAESYDMAQVPQRSPANSGPRAQGARPSFEQALADFQALVSAQ
jgi:hypothetical protein